MRAEEIQFIEIRKPTREHTDLKIPHSRNKSKRDFYREIGLVFEHQKAVFAAPTDNESQEVTLARFFYKKCYK